MSPITRRTALAALGGGYLWGQNRRRPWIDVHHHIIPPGYLRDVGTKAIGEPAGRATAPEWSTAISLDAMDAIGVQTAMTSISAPGFPFQDPKLLRRVVREANDFNKQLSVDHPGRFAMSAAMPLPDTRAAIEEADYAFGTLKAPGIGLLTSYDGHYLGDPLFKDFLDALQKHKAVVYVHPTPCTGSAGVNLGVPPATAEYPHETTRTITSLLFSGTLDRCPDVRFIFSHAGGTLPFLAQRIAGRRDPKVSDGMALVKKLFYDTAQAMLPIPMTALLSFAGPNQIVFGSDFPFIGKDAVDGGTKALRQIFPDPAVLDKIAHQNLIKLFPSLGA